MHARRSFIACSFFWICFIFICVRSWTGNNNNKATDRESFIRRERNAEAQYTVELFMVVDYAAYKWWYGLADEDTDREADTLALINQYYSYVFNGIDLRFRSIDNQPFQIDIGLVGIYVAKSENESEWTSGSTVENGGGAKGERLMVNSSEALEKFQTWVDENEELPKFDHAVLFTGTNLTYAGSPGNTGLAFASSMCRNISNSSIVEDTFDFRTITFASQQIARSLGASDDMDNNDCLEFFNYIMTPKLKLPMKKFPANRWTFSSCSVTYFQEYLDTLNEDDLNCLLNTTLSEKYPQDLAALTEELPGQLYGADQQCFRAYGRGSFVCRNEIKSKYKNVCYGLPCYIPDRETCNLILPADGTPCGNKKYCMKGMCRTFDDAEELSDSCPYGNTPNVNCSGVYQMPSACYQPLILYDCCDSCSNVSLPKKGCEYGDRISSCTIEDCLQNGVEYSSVTCCLTCEGVSPTTPSSGTQYPSPLYPSSAKTTVDRNEVTYTKFSNTTSTTDSPTASTTTGSFTSTSDDIQSAETTTSSVTTATISSTDVKCSAITEPSSSIKSVSTGEELSFIPVDAETVSASTEPLHTIPRAKRSSPMVFTKTVLKTAYPIKSPVTVKPVLPNGYQAFVNNGLKRTTTTGLGKSKYSMTNKYPQTAGVTIDRFGTSTSRSSLTTIGSSNKPLVETPASALVGSTSSAITPKASTADTKVEQTLTSSVTSTLTDAALPTTAKSMITSTSTSKSIESPLPSTLTTSPSTTTCPTQPEKEWDRNLSALNRQFFSKLAITMKTKQRQVLIETYRKLKHMYRDITAIFKERKDDEDIMGSNSDSPSFDNSDILQLIVPIWRRDKKDMIISLSSKLKTLRYKVLAMTKSYLTRQIRR